MAMETHQHDASKEALTIEQFARAHSISRGHVYNLIRKGHGPRLMRVGKRTLVSKEAAEEWRRRMEAAEA